MALTGSITLRYLVYNIQDMLRQSFAETEIEFSHILYWVRVHADRLKQQHVAKIDSGDHLTIFPAIPCLVESATGRNYCVIPASIYDYHEDKGINYISYIPVVDYDTPPFTSVQFTRTNPSQSRRLYFRDEERPSPSNPYFYRVHDNIYFLGVENIDLQVVEAGLLLSIDATSEVDIDEPFDFPPHLVPVLEAELLKMGTFMLQIPKDIVADAQSAQAANINQASQTLKGREQLLPQEQQGEDVKLTQ